MKKERGKGTLDSRPLQKSRDHPQDLGIIHLRIVEPWSIDQHHFTPVKGEWSGELDLRCARQKVGPYFEVVESTRKIHKLLKDGQRNS